MDFGTFHLEISSMEKHDQTDLCVHCGTIIPCDMGLTTEEGSEEKQNGVGVTYIEMLTLCGLVFEN